MGLRVGHDLSWDPQAGVGILAMSYQRGPAACSGLPRPQLPSARGCITHVARVMPAQHMPAGALLPRMQLRASPPAGPKLRRSVPGCKPPLGSHAAPTAARQRLALLRTVVSTPRGPGICRVSPH